LYEKEIGCFIIYRDGYVLLRSGGITELRIETLKSWPTIKQILAD